MMMIGLFVFSLCLFEVFTVKFCGVTSPPKRSVHEGFNKIEHFPWFGFLYYQSSVRKYTTAVVLVTRQTVLATAAEIDSLPKSTIRARARIVLGQNCSGQPIGIRDYTYHPEYSNGKLVSSFAIIQLETDSIRPNYDLRPICSPPPHYRNPVFYAMVPAHDCHTSKMMIYKMTFVPLNECKSFYRRTGLDMESIWPKYTVCAKSLAGGHCVWRSGAILTVKAGDRWRLLGFGVYGPGCQAPARFLDYNMYYEWVRRNIARIGRPALTIVDENHIILRRMLSHIQRFGDCDYEETIFQLYSDTSTLKNPGFPGRYKYNISLFENVEYSCIVVKALNLKRGLPQPKIRLRKWCSGDTGFCSGYGLLSIHFYLDIVYKFTVTLVVQVYGTEIKQPDVQKVFYTANQVIPVRRVPNFTLTKQIMRQTAYKIDPWFNPTY